MRTLMNAVIEIAWQLDGIYEQ